MNVIHQDSDLLQHKEALQHILHHTLAVVLAVQCCLDLLMLVQREEVADLRTIMFIEHVEINANDMLT